MGRRGLAVVLALATAAAGCATPLPSSPSPLPSSATSAPASPVAVPIVPALDPDQLGITCGDGILFHPSLLDQQGRAEGDPDPVAAALREFLAGPDGAGVPSSGWIRVAQSASRAQFVAPDGSGWAIIGFFLHQGGWSLDLAGGCQPEVVLPGGAQRADWRLDPAFPDPAPVDRQIHVLVHERACAGGDSPEGRILPPMVAVSAEAVSIAIAVRPKPGGNDCSGNPDFPLAVDLPEALGERLLFDGAVFPPAGPIASYVLECGDVEARRCATLAADIAANARRLHPGKLIVQITVTGPDGDYELLFDDGTMIGADIN